MVHGGGREAQRGEVSSEPQEPVSSTPALEPSAWATAPSTKLRGHVEDEREASAVFRKGDAAVGC